MKYHFKPPEDPGTVDLLCGTCRETYQELVSRAWLIKEDKGASAVCINCDEKSKARVPFVLTRKALVLIAEQFN